MKTVYSGAKTAGTTAVRAEKEKIEAVAEGATRELYRARAVFPFDFFPDEVIVFPDKVHIVSRFFWFSKKVFPIIVDDIQTVTMTANPFFARLRFEIIGFEQNPEPVNYLKRSEATRVRRLITGLQLCRKREIDLRNLDAQQIIDKAEEIGKTKVEG